MKVVTTNGCFDILHIGHIRLLERAKSLGDYLIVCINSDNSVKRLKGENRPIFNQEERKRMLLALKCVNEVRVFEEDNPIEIIKKIRPNIHVKSISGYKGIEGDTVRGCGGILMLFPDIESVSTTKIIEKIRNG
jgi:D-beta-D-heptose 7-phosphate kinase/D-beta-D-heptose 1-phosphate adenosyltransferase